MMTLPTGGRPRAARLAFAALAASLSLSLLAGCGSTKELDAPAPSQATAYPSLTDKQVAQVIDQIDKALKAGDAANDPKPLDARLENPARTMRAAQYAIKAADAQQGFEQIPTKPVSVTVTSTTKWPRAIVDVTAAPPNSLPYILVIRQHDAHSPYRLWQWMRLLPGKSVPATAIVKKGSPAVAPDSKKGLKLTPLQARDMWAAAVLDPQAQQGKVVEDALMSSIRAEQKQLADAIGDSGTVAGHIQPGADVVAVALSTGGVLVAANYAYRTDVTVNEGRPGIRAQGNIGLLLGEEGTITSKAHWVYEVTTLLQIPPASAKNQQIEVIGGEKVLFEAARD